MISSQHSRLVQCASIFALALCLRLIFLLYAGDAGWPHSTYFEGDAPLFAQWAASLDRSEPFEQGLPLHSPVIAHLMKWLLPSTNSQGLPAPARDFQYLKIAWCFLSAATCAMLFWSVSAWSSARAGLFAGGLSALSFANDVTATSLNTECVYAFGIVAIVVLTLRWIERPTSFLSMLLGALHGGCALLRPEHPLLFCMLVIWMLFRRTPSVPVERDAQDDQTSIAPTKRRYTRLPGVVSVLVSFAVVCVPWSIRSAQAIHRFNTVENAPVEFDKSPVVWTEAARQYVKSLPAFARKDNFNYVSASLAARGQKTIDADDVRRFLFEQFAYVPEKMSEFALVSSQGPLAFALANHSRADGGFSKVALDSRFGQDPPLQLSLPSHLRLFNHGYAVGLEWIRQEPAAWLRLVFKKYERFWNGVTLGFGATNWPHGRSSLREPTDIATPIARNITWDIVWAVLLLTGTVVAFVKKIARVWVLVILYKLIVTAAFFGYARQSVSILPAFFVLAALSLDGLLSLLPQGKWWLRAGWSSMAILAIATMWIDLTAAKTHTEARIRGPAHLSPQWGAGAFESTQRIELLLEKPGEK